MTQSSITNSATLSPQMATFTVRSKKGMYGLTQVGIIVQELLADRLKQHGYTQSETTPGLWSNKIHPIQFSLVIDNLGVKYIGKENALPLLNTIQKYYKCSCNWDGKKILRTYNQVGL
jgi:hypothetical protein